MNNGWIMKNRFTNVHLVEQAVFLKRLGELLEKGYSLPQGIEFLKLQLSERWKVDLQECLVKLKEGNSLEQALAHIPFSRDTLSYLYFAEKHGNLAFAFIESANMLEKKIENIKKLKKIIQYPLFLMLFLLCMMYVIEKILLPQFKNVYASMNVKSTILVDVLFFISSIWPTFMTLVICLAAIMVIFYHVSFKKMPPHSQMELLLKLPLIRNILIKMNSHYFSFQLSNLLKAGLSIFESLQMFEAQSLLPFYKKEAEEIMELLKAGEKLENILFSRPCYEKQLSYVIAHGQANGNLANALYHYSQFVLERLEDEVNVKIVYLQPTLFLSIGGFVILMYLAIFIPMFQMLNTI
jgi:competence protein ComGB